MGMEEKNILVKQYIMDRGAELNNKYPGIVDDNKINRAIAMFTNSEKSLEELKEQINELIHTSINFCIHPTINLFKYKYFLFIKLLIYAKFVELNDIMVL